MKVERDFFLMQSYRESEWVKVKVGGEMKELLGG